MPRLLLPEPPSSGNRSRVIPSARADASVQFGWFEAPAFDYVVRSVADLPAPSGGYINLPTGSYAMAADVDIGSNALRILPGVQVWIDGFGHAVQSSGRVVELDGQLNAQNLELIDSQVGGANQCVRLYNANAELRLQNCVLTSLASRGCINVVNGRLIWVRGGEMNSSDCGVRFAGPLDWFVLESVKAACTSDFVCWVTGVQGWGCVARCSAVAATGINWAAANVPTNGLLLVGNDLDCTVPLSGFTAASALVNAKANTTAGALLSETPIVP